VEINAKTIAALIFVAGIGYAWYTGMLGDFFGDLGGAMGGRRAGGDQMIE